MQFVSLENGIGGVSGGPFHLSPNLSLRYLTATHAGSVIEDTRGTIAHGRVGLRIPAIGFRHKGT